MKQAAIEYIKSVDELMSRIVLPDKVADEAFEKMTALRNKLLALTKGT